MNPTRIVCMLSALSMSIGTVQAEFIGLNIDKNLVPPAFSGSIMGNHHSSIDLVDDLGVEDSTESSMVLILEHPISALPNVRYSEFDLDSRGSSTSASEGSLKGSGFASGNQVTSSFDLSQNDIVLYYQLSDTSIDLDLGVDLKRFDGQVSMTGEDRASVNVDETIPLLYLSARYTWPNTGFYVGADINSSIIDLGFSDSSAEDTTIKLGYESDSGLGVEGGYKYYSLELENGDSLDTDLKYDGLFLNGYYNF